MGDVSDFIEERRVLQTTALPELRDYCVQQGLELQVVDFPTSPGEQENIGHQLDELDACRKESFGPYFVVCTLKFYSDMIYTQ